MARRAGVDLSDDMVRGARQFASMRLAAVVTGHSSSSFLGGKGWDEAVVEALAAILAPGTTATTNGLDTVAALQASGVQRPFLVLPPWFNDATLEAGLRYYRDHGFAPAGALRYDPGPDWRDVPFAAMYPRGLGFAQHVEPLHAQVVAACPADADGMLIAGTGFRCVAIIDALEEALQRPVLSANQRSLWRCLRIAGVREGIAGYGKLLSI
jgi:maleate isomerase